MRACVRACVCVRVRACARACARVRAYNIQYTQHPDPLELAGGGGGPAVVAARGGAVVVAAVVVGRGGGGGQRGGGGGGGGGGVDGPQLPQQQVELLRQPPLPAPPRLIFVLTPTLHLLQVETPPSTYFFAPARPPRPHPTHRARTRHPPPRRAGKMQRSAPGRAGPGRIGRAGPGRAGPGRAGPARLGCTCSGV